MIELKGTVDPVKVTPEGMHAFYKHPKSSEKHWLRDDDGIFEMHYKKRKSERVYSEELEGDWNYRTELTIYHQTYPGDNYHGEVTGSIIDTWIGVGEPEELKRRAQELNYQKIID
jgi:hypothetical protein